MKVTSVSYTVMYNISGNQGKHNIFIVFNGICSVFQIKKSVSGIFLITNIKKITHSLKEILVKLKLFLEVIWFLVFK